MAELKTYLIKIKDGEIGGLLEDIKELLKSCSSTTETQQLIRHCSRYVYDQPNLPQKNFSDIVSIVEVCCKHQHGQSLEDPVFHIKSMYYIIAMASKRKELHQYLNALLSDLEPYLNACGATVADVQSIVRHMYSVIWKVSLEAATPLERLTLQKYSLLLQLSVEADTFRICDQATKTLIRYELENKSLDKTQDFCLSFLTSLTRTLMRTKSFDDKIVLLIVHLVMQYSKALTLAGKCSDFSKITRSVVGVLEKGCDQNTVLALKVGLKLTEVGMALKMGKCQEDMLVKFLESSKMVPDGTLPNMIMLTSLLCTTDLFEVPGQEIMYSLKPAVLCKIVDLVLVRCSSSVTEENAKKVATLLTQQLLISIHMWKTSQNQSSVLKQALSWTLKTKSFITNQLNKLSSSHFVIYNAGVNAGNLGVLAFKMGSHDSSAMFLETCVEMFILVSSLNAEKKHGYNAVLGRKTKLWSDALRYSGNYWDAAVVACRGMLLGYIPQEDAISIFVKCKRDAENAKNTKLRGLTICDIVLEARRKYETSNEFVFDSLSALQCEIVNYKKQSHDTTEDQLSCGRKILECVKTPEEKIRGYLIVAEILWAQPSLAKPEEAVQSVKKAISIIAERKDGGKHISGLKELEASAYFLLYLCHLQQIQDVASSEVQEASKPVSLSVQATDLGEEVQVDDSCDVRPAPTCLTLYAQETSLSSLHIALSIWESIESQNETLKDPESCFASLASVGYIYQLSGLVNLTVRSWSVLVSLAYRHSNKVYFVKGVTELLLIAPELISSELVKEAEHMRTKCQAEIQDGSFSYTSLNLTSAISYYFLKNGEYKKSGQYLKQALESELMAKKTVKSTEAMSLVHYVASHYAWLPSWVIGPNYKPAKPCLSLAILASREAMAVMNSASATSQDILCWRHRVAWLHLTTNKWLGHLCWASAQPRLARAYLKLALTLTQELALPLRTGEILELLARIDLLCDQLDHCQVKVDSILGILVAHPSNPQSFTAMTKRPDVVVSDETANTKKETEQIAFQIFSAADNSDEESIRSCSNGSEYEVKSVKFNDALVVVGPEDRISHLACPKSPPSPSLKYREESTIVKVEQCTQEDGMCLVCASPVVHQLRMVASVYYAYIYAHKGNFRPARNNLNAFTEMFDVITKKTSHICSHILSSVRSEWKNRNQVSRFVEAKLNFVHLQSLHCRAEVLSLQKDLNEALEASVKSHKTILSLDNKLLFQDLQLVTVILLQKVALERALSQKKTKVADSGVEGIQVIELSDSEELPSASFKTPAHHLKKASVRKSHRLPRKATAPRKGGNYNFFSDEDDDDQESVEAAKHTRDHNERLIKTSHRIPRKATAPKKGGKYNFSSDEDEGDQEEPEAARHTRDRNERLVKTCVKKTSGVMSKNLTRTCLKKQHVDVEDVGNRLGNLTLDASPSSCFLKVTNSLANLPKSVSLKTGSLESENKCSFVSEDIIKISEAKNQISTSNTERKKRVVRKLQNAPTIPTVLVFSDETSPDHREVHLDDFNATGKEERKQTRGRPRGTVGESNPRPESKGTTSLSKCKIGSDTKAKPKTRSSRTIR